MTPARVNPARKQTAATWRELLASDVLPGVDAAGGRKVGGGEGKIYFNARYYDPTTGRFLTEDPSRQGVNWYAYCDNDPINKTDPDGRQSELGSGIVHGLESTLRVDFGREEFGYAYNAPNALAAAGWTVAGVGKMALDIGKAAAVAAAIPAIATAIGTGLGIQALSRGTVGSATTAMTESPGISGYTRHGLNQAISREGVGVAARAILDAVRNPANVAQQAGKAVEYVGQSATVVLNQASKVITTWATTKEGWRIQP